MTTAQAEPKTRPGDGAVAEAVRQAVARHGDTSEALIPILSDVNRALGFLSPEALAAVAAALSATRGQVHSVATFYSLLSTRPAGRHVIAFCADAPCHVVGGRQVWQALQELVGLAPGETSADGRWTLLITSCIGVCGVGPVIVIDDDIHAHLTPAALPGLLERYP
jgi:NADH:ubiquinone oxidoreductase subunit E